MRVKGFSLLAFLLLLTAALAVPVYGASTGPKGGSSSSVQSFAPTGRVSDNVSFRMVFRNPMVGKDKTGKPVGVEDFPFTVEPPVQAEGKWQNERTFTARLLAPLRMATAYTATVKPGLKDRRGGRIAEATYSFQTDAFSPTDIQAVTDRNGRARFTLSFNMRVDPNRLKGFLTVLNEKGQKLDYSISGALPGKTVTLTVPVESTSSRQRFTVKVAAGMTGSEGDLGLKDEFSSTVVLDPKLMVSSVSGDDGTIRVYFNFNVDPNAVKNFISIEPKESFTVAPGWSDNAIFLRSDEFKPRSRFAVTMKRGLPAKDGLVLKEDFTQAVIMPDLESDVTLSASGSYLTALGKGLIPIELVNVKKLQVDLYRLYENNIPYVIRGDYHNFQKDLSRRVYSREYNLSLPLNERVRRSLAVEDMVSGAEKDARRGLFLLSVRDTEKGYWSEESQIINLSDLGAVARVWEDGILLWVNTLTGTEPVKDAAVRVYSGSNQVIAEGRTGDDGVFLYERDAAWEPGAEPRLAIVSSGDDLTYVQLTRSLLSRETFDTAGRPWIRDGYDAIIFSPRDIYRTGEEASFKAVVRNADVTTPQPFPVLFVARDPLGRKVRQETVVLNGQGSAIFNLPIASNALTGLWNLSLVIPGREDSPIASMSFNVEDFAPPRIEVKVDTDSETLTHEDVFTASVYARWLFGVDGANLPYKAKWSARAADFTPKKDKWKGYSFGDPSREFSYVENDFNPGNLDESGRMNLSLTLNADWQAASIINITMRAEVMEDGGRWVSSSVTRPYFPAPWLLGIAPKDEKMAVGRDLKFSVVAIDADEDPTDPGELNATLYHVRWNYNMVEVDGYRRWQSTEELIEADEKSLTLKNGAGTLSFKPTEWGTYMIRVSDENDNARAVYRFFADDPQYAGVGSALLDRVEMTMDKEFYKVGDTAKVTMRVPFEGLLLLGVEGAKLSSRTIHKVDRAELTVDVPVTDDLVPNGWVTAWLIRPVKEDDAEAWGGHRAIGVARLKTDLSGHKLDVAMKADFSGSKAEPAATLPVTLTLKDADGKAVNDADVAIALVDDAVLGLTGYKTPDLLNHFYGLRRLGSNGYDFYDQLIPVESRATEPLHPAGGAAMAALAGDGNVQRFKILSLFEGHVTAGSDGVAKAELDLPEFSGRGRLFAVVADGDRFGMSEQQIEIARSIVTETNMPRFAAPGDVFAAPITVFNTSDEERRVEIKISAPTGGLEPEKSGATLTIAPGESAKWSTNVRAMDADAAKWQVTTSWSEDGEDKSFTQEIDLPIRSPWPVVARSGSGMFEAGDTEIEVPLDSFSGKPVGTLTLADTPAADLTRAVSMLSNYPYGCLEQTISAAWPFIVLPDAIAEVDPLLVNSEAVRMKTNDAIARVQAMQLYDGSFAMWPGNSTPYIWGSVYAAHFLIEARNAGIAYPEEMLEGVMNWLRQFMASMPANQYPTETQDDFTAKAYGAYVLTLYGEKPLGWIEYLRENQDSMWPSGRIWLAGAQALIEGRADALRDLNLGASKIPDEARWRTLESDSRNTAQLLSLWLEVEPQAEEALELAARLVKQGQNGQWFSTQDNAASLIALARYNLAVGGEKASLTGTLSGDGKELLSYRSGKSASVELSAEGPDAFTLSADGSGRGYYSWNLTGTPKTQPRSEHRGINVECAWFDENGNAVDTSRPLPQGTRLTITLTIRPSAAVSNVALSYLLPAGLELDNPRLDDTAEVTPGSYGIVNDVRDDRLLLFFDRINGEVSYGFKARAVTRGTFAVPPVSAVGMYDPSVRFTGRAQQELVIE